MTKSNGIDPTGQFARAAMLKAKATALDAPIAAWTAKSDTNGLLDLKLHQIDLLQRAAEGPST